MITKEEARATARMVLEEMRNPQWAGGSILAVDPEYSAAVIQAVLELIDQGSVSLLVNAPNARTALSQHAHNIFMIEGGRI
jgi:hypothetical protein